MTEIKEIADNRYEIVAGGIPITVHSFFRPDKSVGEIVAMVTDMGGNCGQNRYTVRIWKPAEEYHGGTLPVSVDMYSKDGRYLWTAYYDFDGYE